MSGAKKSVGRSCLVAADECALFEALVSRWRVPLAFADTRTPIRDVLCDIWGHTSHAECNDPVAAHKDESSSSSEYEGAVKRVSRWVAALAAAVSPYTPAHTHALCAACEAGAAWPLVRVRACAGAAPVSAARMLLRRADCPRAFRRWVAALLRGGPAPAAAEARASAAVHAALAAGTAFDDAHWRALPLPLPSAPEPAPVALAPAPVVGTSRALERPYARLTRAADPAAVRPAAVLAAALAQAEAAQRAGRWTYAHAREQYRAMRQDLAVQHLAGPLARAVYRSSARAALAAADYPELSLCLQHVGRLSSRSDADAEFVCLRLLLALAVGDSAAVRAAVAAHAHTRAAPLRVCLALAHLFLARAWPAFVRRALAATCSGSSDVLVRARGLVDVLVAQARFWQLRALCSACYGTVPRALLVHALGFADAAACAQHCAALGLECDAATGALAVGPARTRLASLSVPSLPLETP